MRREIDALDAELLTLLNRRAAAVLEVAAIKSRQADEPRYYRPEREAALLRRLAARNEGPLPDTEAVRLFREIVSTCRTLEQRPAIACATVAGACAALGHFGGAVDLHVVPNAAEALAAVRAAVAVAERTTAVAAPVLAEGAAAGETAGVAERTTAVAAPAFAEGAAAGETAGVAERTTAVAAPALAEGAATGETAGVAREPAAAARCDHAVIEFSPGGEADPAVADVAGAGLVLCGEWYATSGERYVVIGREPVPPTGEDWTSLVAAADRVADLESRCAALELMVRSTPIAGRASSIADVAAHSDDPRLAGLLAEYGGERAVLGAYPNARIGGPSRARAR